MTEHLLKAYKVDIDFRINGFEKANEVGYPGGNTGNKFRSYLPG